MHLWHINDCWLFFLDITSSLTSWHDWGSVNLFLKKFINKKIKEGEERKAANSWSCTDGAQFHKKNALKLLLVGVFELFKDIFNLLLQ